MQSFRDLMPRDPVAFSAMVDSFFGARLTTEMRARFLANDIDALLALTTDRASNADVIASMKVPCLLIVGELDPRMMQVRQCASELSNATFLCLRGCDHVDSIARIDLVLPHLTAFLEARSASG